jgi:hypothetical protein
MEVRHYDGYGLLQSRWGTGMGDDFLWTRRSADRPNTFSQALRELEPGRLYSLKMITSDYQDLLAGESNRRRHAVSVRLDGVDLLSGPRDSFQYPFPHGYGKRDKFDAQHQYWLNYHWRVFRARGTTATLAVSDWENPKEPGGTAGRELMFNFIEVQPYLEP